MAIFIVTSDGSVDAEGLTFNEAVTAANATPEADTIRFADELVVVELSDVAVVSGELTIEGDRDGDGISDVILKAARDHRHLTIEEGADVTVRNIDFATGYDRPRTSDGIRQADTGEHGSEGTLTPGILLDGASGNDDAGHGGNGAEGDDGLHAAGSIWNDGTLRLERVGFGNNQAFGETGEHGGFGGNGGSSWAGDGQRDDLSQIRTSLFNDPLTVLLEENLVPGGDGGNGGRGGNGGDGADGGDGGHAAATILNRGVLTLVDTVFGGRLSSGVYANGNEATGGAAGNAGGGGLGGSSYGGDGGASGIDFAGNRSVVWYIPEAFWDEPWANTGAVGDNSATAGPDDPEERFFSVTIAQHVTGEAGVGGDAGRGGDGGDGGNGGNGGGAGTVVNLGSLTGKAALLPDVEDFLVNESTAGSAGDKGNGRSGGQGVAGEGGLELGDVETIYPVALLDTGYYNNDGTHVFEDVGFVQAIIDEIRSWDLNPVGSALNHPVTGQAAFGDDGPSGATGTDGSPGIEGEAVVGVLTAEDGQTAFSSTSTLVYLYNLGQDSETGQLAFNVIRLGHFWTEFTVNWQVTGIGSTPVSQADFAPGTALSGSLDFVFAEVTQAQGDGTYAQRYAATDNSQNMHQVVLDVAADALNEAPEGYQIMLSITDSTITLGTDTAAGTIVDTMMGDGEITGMLVEGGPANDPLQGAQGNDTLLGHAGRDTLEGREGDDLMDGGDDIDTALYEGELVDFTLVKSPGQLSIIGPASAGEDTLVDVERVQFDDQSLAFDLDGSAGHTVKLLGVMLGSTGSSDPTLRGIGIDIFDNAGLSFEQVMDVALDVVLPGARSNGGVVDLLWTNLVGGPTPQDVFNDLVGLLDTGAFTQAGLAVVAAEHPINLDNIDLVGLVDAGVAYIPVI